MAQADDLALPYLRLETAEFASNPLPHFAAARARHPWLARCMHGYVVHEYDAICGLMLQDHQLIPNHDSLIAIMDGEGTPWARMVREEILNQNGATHRRLRQVLAPTFTPRNANRLRPMMREVVQALLDEWTPRGTFDFEEFASYFPVTVMCRIIGAPPEAIADLRWSLEQIGLAFSLDKSRLPDLIAATEQLESFVRTLFRQRLDGARLDGERDLLDDLLDAYKGGDLSEQEFCDLLFVLFAAGYDTSKNVLTLMMHTLIRHPDIYRRCAEDPDYCKLVVEEALRFHNPGTVVRTSIAQIEFRDVTFPAGTQFFFPISLAGHDPGKFVEPDRFQPEAKRQNRHLAFGRGTHICLGQFIARAQMEEGWHLIAQRMPNPRQVGDEGWRPFFGVWGIRGLPLAFDTASPVAADAA